MVMRAGQLHRCSLGAREGTACGVRNAQGRGGRQVNGHNPLTPALRHLLESCVQLKTTDAKVLAAHLHRSPATIRTEFQRILATLDVHCRYAALKKAGDEGWINGAAHHSKTTDE